jgi:hypothetical protein
MGKMIEALEANQADRRQVSVDDYDPWAELG